jgi:hypothetical protein
MGNHSLVGYVAGNIAVEFLYSGPHSLLSRTTGGLDLAVASTTTSSRSQAGATGAAVLLSSHATTPEKM